MTSTSNAAFRTALNHRLRNRAAQTGISLSRLRRQIVFELLIARLSTVAPGRYVVKGGFALDIRLGDRARVTKDLDLVATESREAVVRDLATVAEPSDSDRFSFQIDQLATLDDLDGGSAVRFRVRAMLADERFEVFDLDIGFDAPGAIGVERMTGHDLLAFADIPAVRMELISVEQHIAEKIHAYTRIYAEGQQSSRVKDLIDIVLLSELTSMTAADLMGAVRATFQDRSKQPVPVTFPAPPADWATPYRSLAVEVGIDTRLEAGRTAASVFLNPVLGGEVDPEAVWSPDVQRWVIR